MFYSQPTFAPRRALWHVISWCMIASGALRADGTNAAPETASPPVQLLTPSLQIRDTTNPPEGPGSAPPPYGAGPGGTASAPSPAVSADASAPASMPPPSDNSAASAPTAPAAASDSSSNAWKNSYVNLINLLVSRGVLTKKDSTNLVTQAEHDAQAASSTASSPQAQAATALASPATPASSDNDTMQVTYVPESVKAQMRDEIKQDVMQQARDEHWAAPDSTPDWVKRYHVTADIRVRYQGDFYPAGNDDNGAFINFNSINNSSSAYDATVPVTQQTPYFNVNQDRDRFRLRARIGADIDVGDGFTAGLRVATGSDNSPVTENQTLDAGTGNFAKYSLWLDRAFLTYELGGTPKEDFSVTIGRFNNPFFSSSMIWSDDLGFDGMVAKGKYEVTEGVTPFITAGAFPVFNTDLNFGTYNPNKFESEDKWLYAGQTGINWKISDDFNFKGAVAYYDFENVQGQISGPVDPINATDVEPTDDSRPLFAQNGNTYVALRDIVPSANNGFGTTDQWQYYGLATPFHELAITEQLDYTGFAPFDVSLLGEFVDNLAFDRTSIENYGPTMGVPGPGPVNNLSNGLTGNFVGGNKGYDVRLTVGDPALEKLWDWNVNLTYRYVETDATVDGFTDSDFGGSLAGTNLKGYIIGGNLALTSRVWTTLRWMSADAIVGAPYESNLIQFDINAKF